MRNLNFFARLFAVIFAAGALVPSAFGSACTDLRTIVLPHSSITSAVEMPAGTFTPSTENASAERKTYPAAVPAFCRVIGVIHPVPESTIKFEVWLPSPDAWNHRLEGVGNGAYSGRISYGPLENAINLGYAAASTDTGHTGSDLKFAVDHPERIVDWGYRAVHVTTEAAKLILAKYYGTAPTHSYFNGCSTGGHQALQEAQRFPEDYDGILAGDAGNDRVHLNVGFMWGFAAVHPEGRLILPEDKLPLIHKAAVAACDAILEDPLACKFDPGVLLCKGAETAACLTSAQVEGVRKIYAGPHNPHTGEQIIAGYAPGSEIVTGGDYSGWKNFIVGPKEPSRLDFWKYWVFNKPDWDWHTFDYDHDIAFADSKMADANANNADLQSFKAHGGKQIMYHGWADPVGPPGDAIDYYARVQQTAGGAEKTQDFLRLFLVPGMSHCNGGAGYEVAGGARGVDDPNGVPKWPEPDPEHDMLSALDQWVSKGVAPKQIIAAHRKEGTIDRTIPVCAYPKVARWSGKGSSDEAKNYSCVSKHP
jgi:feruloyl esterase